MKIQINIEKKHMLILIFGFVALASLIIVVAQPSTPNPGHAITEVPGAAPNCLTNYGHSYCIAARYFQFITAAGGEGIVSIAAAKSSDSDRLGGKPATSYISSCRTVTANAGIALDVKAYCELDEILTGGGCRPSSEVGLRWTEPWILGSNQKSYWFCGFQSPSGEAIAVCCT